MNSSSTHQYRNSRAGSQSIADRDFHFPYLYAAIIVAGSLDLLFTGIILGLGGQEANPLANAILHTHGFTGMVTFKYLVVGLVILACEFVADRNQRKGLALAVILIVIHSAPVVWSSGLLIFAL